MTVPLSPEQVVNAFCNLDTTLFRTVMSPMTAPENVPTIINYKTHTCACVCVCVCIHVQDDFVKHSKLKRRMAKLEEESSQYGILSLLL